MNRGRGRNPGSFSSSPGRSSIAFNSNHRHNKADGQRENLAPEFGDGRLFASGRGRSTLFNSEDSFSRNSNNGTPSCYQYRAKNAQGDEIGNTSAKCSNSVSGYKIKTVQDEIGTSKSSDIATSCNLVSRGNPLRSSSGWGSNEVQLDVARIQAGETTGERPRADATFSVDFSAKLNISNQQNESRLYLQSPMKEDLISNESSFDNTEHTGYSEHLEQQSVIHPFDLFLSKAGTSVMLKPSLLVKNREKRNEIKRANEGLNGLILRPGMVLLKSYLSIQDQVKIVKLCRDLGLGPGGFYQPQYHDGARLWLKMMCLGKNWDPDKSEYVERRSIDGAKPPAIPHEFHPLVEKAIKDAHALIQKDSKRSRVEDILPRMSPNLCIVNFYSRTGRLGLHQDKDESQESLCKGLPVVSFSIGDSGEFLYGDERNVDKAEKKILESGDVLIFGGKSRHVFHGVSSVLPNTAPKALLDDTNLHPGRLNLTFREY